MNALIEKTGSELRNELHSIVLFGSYAKGGEQKESDIDLLFVTSNLNCTKKVETICNGISAAYGKKLAPIVSDVEQFEQMLRAKEQTIGKEALADGVVLVGHEKVYEMILGERYGT